MALLDRGADPSARTGGSAKAWTLTQFSALVIEITNAGRLEVIRLLLSRGAEVNARGSDYDGNALQAAARRDHLPVIELLVKLRADINARGGDCDSCHGTADTVRLPLEHGTDVNARWAKYPTALIIAPHRCRVENVRILLEHGADIHVKDKFWGSALEAAPNRPQYSVPQQGSNSRLINKAWSHGNGVARLLVTALVTGHARGNDLMKNVAR